MNRTDAHNAENIIRNEKQPEETPEKAPWSGFQATAAAVEDVPEKAPEPGSSTGADTKEPASGTGLSDKKSAAESLADVETQAGNAGACADTPDGGAENRPEDSSLAVSGNEPPGDMSGSSSEHPLRIESGDTGFLLVTTILLLVILAAVCWAQPENNWWLANDPDRSLVAAYLQAEERSAIAAYCQQMASITGNLSRALAEIGRLAAEYDPETAGPRWTEAMEAEIAAVKTETARARLLSPPAACASAHALGMGGIKRIDEAMAILEKDLPDLEPQPIQTSHQQLEEGMAMLEQSLQELESVNQGASG